MKTEVTSEVTLFYGTCFIIFQRASFCLTVQSKRGATQCFRAAKTIFNKFNYQGQMIIESNEKGSKENLIS